MDFYKYFQSYDNYFWQWEEDASYLAIPNGSTIAYRGYINNVIERIAPNGLPSFNILLLIIIATNPNSKKNLAAVSSILAGVIKGYEEEDNSPLIGGVLIFLARLSRIPLQYKSGKKRLLLFQSILTPSPSNSRPSGLMQPQDLTGKLNHFENTLNIELLISKKTTNIPLTIKDLWLLDQLNNQFPTINSILERIAGLPAIEEDILLEKNDNTAVEPNDLIEDLIEDPKTFNVGALVKRIWSGLDLPVNNIVQDQQQMGGVSDLTNKGNFDRLLISEYANDDIVFLSRLANNEALYIQREAPPSNHNTEKVILIDITLKTWGIPKVMAFATMLAIAKHPKSRAESKVFVVGDTFTPVSYDNVHTIIDGLQEVDASLHPAKGISAFFKAYPPNKNREVFIITEPTTFNQTAMTKVLNDHFDAINYWIHTQADGEINVFKNQRKSKKHIQRILLPLDKLWEKRKNSPNTEIEPEVPTSFPILFNNSQASAGFRTNQYGELFKITKAGALLRKQVAKNKPQEKGWVLLYESLLLTNSRFFEIGTLPNSDYILLIIKPSQKEFLLVNLQTKSKKTFPLELYYPGQIQGPVFYKKHFYYSRGEVTWSINIQGETQQCDRSEEIDRAFAQRKDEMHNLRDPCLSMASLLVNIHKISINDRHHLVFNSKHQLHLNYGKHVKLDLNQSSTDVVVAERKSRTLFVFKDGSHIIINRNGMFTLVSSSENIPAIYVPAALNTSIAAATGTCFAGNTYYYEEDLYNVILEEPGPALLRVVKHIRDYYGMELNEAKKVVDNAPSLLIHSIRKEETNTVKRALKELGATVKISSQSQHSRSLKKIDSQHFFNNFVGPFINKIVHDSRHKTTGEK